MSDPKPPRVEFPCNYLLKVMGDASPDFHQVVVAVIREHAPEVTPEHISVRESRNGRFLSVNVTIRATGETQLQAIFASLKQTGRVHMVL